MLDLGKIVGWTRTEETINQREDLLWPHQPEDRQQCCKSYNCASQWTRLLPWSPWLSQGKSADHRQDWGHNGPAELRRKDLKGESAPRFAEHSYMKWHQGQPKAVRSGGQWPMPGSRKVWELREAGLAGLQARQSLGWGGVSTDGKRLGAHIQPCPVMRPQTATCDGPSDLWLRTFLRKSRIVYL